MRHSGAPALQVVKSSGVFNKADRIQSCNPFSQAASIGFAALYFSYFSCQESGTDAREVTRFLKQSWNRHHAIREMDFFRTAPAAVMMRADAGLIHASDQGRATGRTDWCRDEGIDKASAFARQAVHMRRLDQRLAIAGKIRRHVINHEP